MKQKILTKQTIISTVEETGGKKTETSEIKTDETVGQTEICENIYNLASALSLVSDIDGSALGLDNEIRELKLNLVNSILYQSRYLPHET